ncbi:MAG: hypothetical protein LAP38_29020, partial [Acidobacteriia bacterium]|nr:hypothetical protein [Terriglobia bacterium]
LSAPLTPPAPVAAGSLGLSAPLTPPAPVAARPLDLGAVARVPGAPARSDAAVETPSFHMQEHSFGGERWLWLLPVVLVLGVIAFVVYHKTAGSVGSSSVAPIALRIAGQGRNVQISWDQNAAPIQTADHAVIKIQDGPATSEIALSSDKLHSGPASYLRRSNDVGFDMTVYTQAGSEVHEYARLVVQESPASAPSSGIESPDASQLRIQRLEYEAQIKQLKEDARKQAARADQLQDVVRILQNRMSVDAGRHSSDADKQSK